ncbi:MAG TPA: hypothetical protein VFQ51_09025 [Vicinamibacteria bacterium]|nr:hypothetical protein [Vicinamibacteria bacterium]
MTTLKETLPLLEKSVPTFPGKLAEVEKESDACAEAVRGLLEDLQKRKARAEELASEVRTALIELRSSTQTRTSQLQTALQAVEAAVAAASQALDAGADTVKDRLAAVAGALDAFEDRVLEAQSRSMSAHRDVKGAFETLSDELSTGYDDVASAVDASIKASDEVEERAGDAEERVVAATGALVKLAADLGERTEGTLAVWEAALREEGEDHEEALNAALDAVREELVSCQVQREAELTVGVKAVVLETLMDLSKVGDELDQSAGRIDEACGRDQGQAALAYTELQPRITVLEAAVVEVKRGAAILGKEW